MTEAFIKRCASALWTERGRLFFSGLGALMLWFLLGQKVETSETIPVEVRWLSAGQDWPQGGGLFIRVPAHLALSDVQPRSLDLQVSGPAEEISKLDHSLRGTFQVPAGFLGDQEQATEELDVFERFDFGQLKTLNILPEARQRISLTLTRRHVENLTLSKANLTFSDPGLAEDVQINFEPTIIRVSGPARQARRLRDNPALFQLTGINAEAFSSASRGQLKVLARLGVFGPEGDRLERMSVEDRDSVIRITLTKQQRFRPVVLEGLEIVPHVPDRKWPPGINRERPLNLQPETARATLSVPEEYFKEGGDQEAIRERLNLFVDLGEMPFDTEAANLPVRFEGFPKGSSVSVEPALIDVIWNTPKTPETKEESNP